MDKDQFPPDYTPFSLTGSADDDGDRLAEHKLSPSLGLVVFILVFAFLFAALLW